MPKTHLFVAVFVLVFVFSPTLSATILANHPVAGQTLQILDEGAGNASVILTAPDGSIQTIVLYNGQLSVIVEQPGNWLIQIGNEKQQVMVENPLPTAPSLPPVSPPIFLVLLFSFILVVLSMAGAAAWSLTFPPAAPQSPVLFKHRQNGQVHVGLRAGSLPLHHVQLQDGAGPDWPAAPLHIHCAQLCAGQALQMHYAYDGPLGAAHARFVVLGQEKELACAQGETRLPSSDEESFPPAAATSIRTPPALSTRPLRKLPRHP